MNHGERCNNYFSEALDLADHPDFVFVRCRKILEVILKDIYCESMGLEKVPFIQKKLFLILNFITY